MNSILQHSCWEDTSNYKPSGVLRIFWGFVGFLSLRWTLRWLLGVPEMAISLASNWGPTVEDPTWNVVLKVLYWTVAITLYFLVPTVFAVLLAVQLAVTLWKIRRVFRQAIKEKGWFKGVFVGLWRVVPVVSDPVVAGFKDWYKKRLKQHVAAKQTPNPPEVKQPTRRGSRQRKKLKMHTGKDKPSKAALKRWKTENLPLPHEGDDRYGMKPGEYYFVDYVLEEHDADVVGLHYDLRWRHPTLGIVDAVAIPRAALPEVGKPVGAYKSDAKHGRHNLKNIPYAPTGYGAGRTKTLQEGRAMIWVDPESHHLHMVTDKNEAFAFVKAKNAKQDEWLLVRLSDSPVNGKPVKHRERKMNIRDISKNPEKLPLLMNNGYAEVKYDGAMYWLVRDKTGRLALISRRPAHKNNEPIPLDDGYVGIDRIYWVPEVYNLDEEIIPRDSAVQVEVLSQGRGQYDTSHGRTAALLNMGAASSIEQQQKDGPLIVKLLKVEKWDGQDAPTDIFEERKLREEIGRNSKGALHVPAARFTASGASSLLERERRAGREGIMVKTPDGEYKLKNKQTWDYKLSGIYPVDPLNRASNVRSRKEINSTRNPGSKWLSEGVPQGAGGIEYTTESGSIGEAGSGLTDEMRRDLWNNPEKYLGEDNVVMVDGVYRAKDPSKVPYYVEVTGMSRHRKTGVVRAPVVERLRDDK